MKISIDLDGTLYFKPDFFCDFMSQMQRIGHAVGVLTGHKAESQCDDRVKLAAYRFFPDFYLGRTPEYIPFNGAKFKCDMIRAHGIDIHFDDMDYGNLDTVRIFNENLDVLSKVFIVNCAHSSLNVITS